MEEIPLKKWDKNFTIDFCDNWNALGKALLADFNVGKHGTADVYAFHQSENKDERCKSVLNWLGLSHDKDYVNGNYGFVLVRKERECKRLNDLNEIEGFQTLYDKSKVLSSEIKTHLDFFNTYGSHIVTEIILGDVLGQVFVYEKKLYTKVKEAFPEVERSGSDASYFRTYTQHYSRKNDVGYTCASGKVWLASHDSALKEITKDTRDIINQLDESIFMIDRNIELKERLNDIQKITATGLSLTSMADFFEDTKTNKNAQEKIIPLGSSITEQPDEQQKHISKESWELAKKNGLYNRFSSKSEPNFEENEWPDYHSIYKDFIPEHVTTFATRKLSVKRPFVQFNKLNDQILYYKDIVDEFLIVADVVEIDQGEINIPGKKVSIICHRLVCGSKHSSSPKLILDEEAYQSFYIHSKEMVGTLTIQTTGKHKTIAEIEIIEKIESVDKTVSGEVIGRIDAPLVDDLFKIGKEGNWRAKNYLEGLQYNILSAETLLQYFSNTEQHNVAKDHVRWMMNSIIEARKDKEIPLEFTTIINRAKGIYLSGKLDAVFVPTYTYEANKELIQKLTEALKTFEKEEKDIQKDIKREREKQELIANQKTVNENIKEIGTF